MKCATLRVRCGASKRRINFCVCTTEYRGRKIDSNFHLANLVSCAQRNCAWIDDSGELNTIYKWVEFYELLYSGRLNRHTKNHNLIVHYVRWGIAFFSDGMNIHYGQSDPPFHGAYVMLSFEEYNIVKVHTSIYVLYFISTEIASAYFVQRPKTTGFYYIVGLKRHHTR